MNHTPAHPLAFKLLCCSGLLLVTSPWWLTQIAAQPPMGKAADPFAPGAAQPAGEPKKKGEAPVEIPGPESEVILQLRESNPKTADELLRAASAVLSFGRPNESKRYLTKFLEARFPEDDLAPLPGIHGTAFFLDLANNEKLQPEGRQVATQVITAARKFAENPARLAGLVKSLSDPNYEAAAAALTRLEQAGPNLVAPVLQALTDPSRAAEHPRLTAALVELQSSTEAPLIGTLAAAPEPMQVIAAQVLGHIGSRDAVRHLVAPAWAEGVSPALRSAARQALKQIMGGVPSKYECEHYLLRQFEQLRTGQHPFKPDADGRTIVWQWDATLRGPAAARLALQDAIRQLNARLATDLHRLDPQKPDYQQLRLLHYLEFSKAMGGVDRPLAVTSPAFALAKEAGAAATADVLSRAIAGGHHAAAIAATEILGSIGTAELLATDGPAPGVLATALTHADRRLRLAAAITITRLKPTQSFAGASHVTEVLGDAIKTAGIDRVLIADSRTDYCQTLVGLLADQGYAGEVATSSREAFRVATATPDFELILISDVLDLPPTEMVQLLRRDRRTALLPIGVMVGADEVDDLPNALHVPNLRSPVSKVRSQSVASLAALLVDDERTYVAPRPHSSASAAFLAQQVRKLGGRELQSREERVANGRAALAALQSLAADPATFNRFNVLRQEPAVIVALANPSLTAPAADLLATLATPKAQTALVDICSQPARPLVDRQTALKAFQAAVQRRGIMLTQQQILAQYERYNESETLDKPSQAVLAGVLDTLEARAAANPPISSR
jgi:CheY-like chemotaxis protein